MKKLSIFLLFLFFPFLSHADRLTLPSGSKQWSVWRDTYFNPMFQELYESLGANESGVLPDTITLDGLIISGTGDSWLEMNNNTTFSDSLTGKYGIRFYNGVLQQIINGTASAIGSGGSSPTIQANDPTYSDTEGWYLATTSGDTFYVDSGVGVFNVSAGTYTAAPTTPTLTSLTIPTGGDTATAVFSESMTVGAGGNSGWTLNTPTNAMTYSSGSGTDTIVFSLASTIYSTDTPTVSYTQPGNGWESNDDNTDLATISSASVTNNSTQTAGGPVVEDTFTDSDSTSLASHTADSTHTWTHVGTSTMQITSNTAHSVSSSGVGFYASSYEPDDADYSITGTVMATSGASSPIIMVRCSSSAVTGYGVNYNAGTWYLASWVGGTRTEIGTYTGDQPTTAKTVILSASGSSLIVSIDGVNRITATNTAITAAGHPGVGGYYASIPAYVDSIEVNE